MPAIQTIPLPLPHIGSINSWLMTGEPVTLVDTGPRTDQALEALERGLRVCGMRLEDVELVLATHHHHDHVGLAATIKRRSGARIAALDGVAEYGAQYLERVQSDRLFARGLMSDHGVSPALFGPTEELWDYIAATAEPFETDLRLRDGDRIRAGGRDLDVVARPGHSATDTLLVDRAHRLAFVGDHLLAKISPNTEIYRAGGGGRSRSRIGYLAGLKRTARAPLDRALPGHGPIIRGLGAVVDRELAQHRRRCRRILGILERGPADAFAIGRELWHERVVIAQPLLVVWEVLGHLDLLLSAGVAVERQDGDGRWRYSLARNPEHHERADPLVHAA
jgi:glyoxylase-like metal-dependent hydrolase (beta-lactamase superfamily II)